MANDTMKLVLTGGEAIIKSFELLPKKVAAKLVAPVLKAVAKPVVAAARKKLPSKGQNGNTGALRASLGTFMRRQKKSGVRLLVAGARTDTGKKGARTRDRFSRQDSTGQWRIPANYAHLVEFGHRIVTGGSLKRRKILGGLLTVAGKGKATGTVLPRPFLRPAIDQFGQIAVDLGLNRMRVGIEKEATKLSKATGLPIARRL